MDANKLWMMATDCLRHFGLEQQGWKLGWNNRKSSLGCCRGGRRVIELSRPYAVLNNEDEMLDTVLHEIAHAIVGTGHGHDLRWKKYAQFIGAKPQTCANGLELVSPEGKWQAVCVNCNKTHYAHRAIRKSYRCVCLRGTPYDRSKSLVYKKVL